MAITVTLILMACGNSDAAKNASNSIKGTGENVNDVKSYAHKNLASDIVLNNGHRMPRIGLGTWTLSDAKAEECVYFAIKQGYRLIDTAQYYGNEHGVGRGLRRAIDDGLVTREEVFITSKVMPYNYKIPDESIDESLKALGVDYIDLMLIHQPGNNDEAVYKALERGVRSGKLKSIGISNYYTPQQFERINKIAEIVPAVVQNENHIYYQNTALREYVKQYSTVIESWYPFGGRGNTSEGFNNEVIKQLSSKHKKTPAQIITRWHLQAGYVTIPGSSNLKHIAENYDVFDFELTDEEMNQIFELNKNIRYENW